MSPSKIMGGAYREALYAGSGSYLDSSLAPLTLAHKPVRKAFLIRSTTMRYAAVLQFFQYDAALPLEAEIVERYDNTADGFIREKIVFTSPSGDRVPSLLLLPVRATRPYPIVFVMPGGNGRKEYIVDHESKYRAYADALIERGVAVFSLDAAFHNERQSRRGFRESLTAMVS